VCVCVCVCVCACAPNTTNCTVGLDDYPRSRFPYNDEVHVDLLSWMAMAAGVLGDVAEFIGHDASGYRSKRQAYIQSLEGTHAPAAHWLMVMM
jgi:hypothetical protein